LWLVIVLEALILFFLADDSPAVLTVMDSDCRDQGRTFLLTTNCCLLSAVQDVASVVVFS